MFRRSILLLIVLSFISCIDSKQNKKILSESTGDLLICWLYVTNKIGMVLLEKVLDLFFIVIRRASNPEPIFTVSHLPNSVFSGFTKKQTSYQD